MSKRKQDEDHDQDSDQVTCIDVDFEFFDFKPEVDYQAVKRLLIQLFQCDAHLFHLDQLTELILSQPSIGTTIKTDGEDADPYAVLTVLNMLVHQEHPSIKALTEYILSKSASDPSLTETLQALFSPHNQQNVGFVFCERLVNMPVQTVPPMYRLLVDEIKSASDNGEPFRFSHLIFISRTYRLSPEEEQAMRQSSVPSRKRQKALDKSTAHHIPADGIYSFHPEDECIMQLSMHHLSYSFNSAQPREKDSFGLDILGRFMLMDAANLPDLVCLMAEKYHVDS